MANKKSTTSSLPGYKITFLRIKSFTSENDGFFHASVTGVLILCVHPSGQSFLDCAHLQVMGLRLFFLHILDLLLGVALVIVGALA